MNNYSGGDREKAEKYCLRLLAVRARTEYEINKRLEDKGYSPECRLEAVRKLKEKRLIDDEAFTADWIISRIKFKPGSRRLMRQELAAKGINEDMISEALEKEKGILDDRKMSIKIAEDHLSRIVGLSKEKKKIKLYRILLIRGFDTETAREAVESVLRCQQRGKNAF